MEGPHVGALLLHIGKSKNSRAPKKPQTYQVSDYYFVVQENPNYRMRVKYQAV